MKMTTATVHPLEAGISRSFEIQSTRPGLAERPDRLLELLFKALEGLTFHKFIPEGLAWTSEMIEQVHFEGVDLVQWKLVEAPL